MKFKFDANLGNRGRQLIAAGGHDVSTAFDEGLAKTPDAELFAACKTESRALITLDLGFANPFVYRTRCAGPVLPAGGVMSHVGGHDGDGAEVERASSRLA